MLDGGYDEDGSLYLVLELLEGETLAAAIKAEALDTPAIGYVALELLDALAAAHGAGFVHRDIKPENIFLVPDGDAPLVKLLDFGVAGVLADDSPGLTVAGAVLGTPLYMSPEQALGRRVDARSDLWSVGAVLYQAFSGKPPFGGDSFQALLVSISTREHLPLSALRPDLPVRLVSVVERALHKDVTQRWQSAQEMAEALHQALEHGRRARAPAQAAAAPRVPEAALRASIEQRAAAETSASGMPRWWFAALAAVALVAAAGAFMVSRPRHDLRAARASSVDALRPESRATHEPAPPAEPAQAQPRSQPAREPELAHAQPTQPAAVAAVEPAPAPTAAAAAPVAPAAAAAAPAKTSSAALAAVLAAHQGELERCYQESMVAALMKPGAADAPAPASLRLDVELAIDPGGGVRDVTLRGDAPPDMRRCASDAMHAWRFPAADAPSSVMFPVVFQPTVVKP